MKQLMAFYHDGPRGQSGSFDAGIRRAADGDPREPVFPVSRRAGARRRRSRGRAATRINDLELASRLSFFLWSTLPDDELLKLAQRPASCTSRRCCGSRCSACWPTRARSRSPTNFAFQWLNIGKLVGDRSGREHLPVRRRPACRTIRTELKHVRRQRVPREPERDGPA